MLFNSIEFIFFLLPISILFFFLSKKFSQLKLCIYILIFFSFLFYGFWTPIYIFLLIVSITFNYYIAKLLRKNKKKYLLFFGVSANLLVLIYFKYTNFIVDNLNIFLKQKWQISDIALPLAISFFTFQQIAYIVDNFNKDVIKHTFSEYLLFISFFPQLISGPIVMHEKLIPQIQDKKFGNFDFFLVCSGFSLFTMGLMKKIFLADNLAYYSNNLYDSAFIGNKVEFFEGWIGSICFYFQIYFDFSGYTDMALGIALMFGIKLPINFNSPYKSTSIIEFWQRWHITLSQFIKNYLYIPLVSIFTSYTKKNHLMQERINKFPFIFIPVIIPIIITFSLSGLWHGASTTFLIWGLYHGILVSINQFFRTFLIKYKVLKTENIIFKLFSFITTFLCINIGWVFFRANNLDTAISTLKGMFAFNKIILSPRLKQYLPFINENNSFVYFASENQSWLGYIRLEALLIIILSSIICFTCSSSMSLFSFINDSKRKFNPSFLTGFTTGIIFVILIVFIISKSTSEFLYYQF